MRSIRILTTVLFFCIFSNNRCAATLSCIRRHQDCTGPKT